MIKYIAIVLTAAVGGVAGLTFFIGEDNSPAVDLKPVRTVATVSNGTWQEQREARAEQIRAEVAVRFPGADANIISLAARIANRDVPLSDYESDLRALSPADINMGYGRPHGDGFPQYTHTLLREAVLAGNTGAGAILTAGGADLTYNDNELPFQATQRASKPEGYELRFPDYSAGSKFLAMWLREGGDPNITHGLFNDGKGRLISHVPHNNLEGLSFLLAAGADPWAGFDVLAQDGSVLYRLPGFFESLATQDRTDNEVAFRLARMGFYDNRNLDGRERLAKAYEEAAQSRPKGEDPASEATRWAMSKAAGAVFNAISAPRGLHVTELMKGINERGAGGFWLAEGEIRSSPTVSQRTGDRNAWGPERWSNQ